LSKDFLRRSIDLSGIKITPHTSRLKKQNLKTYNWFTVFSKASYDSILRFLPKSVLYSVREIILFTVTNHITSNMKQITQKIFKKNPKMEIFAKALLEFCGSTDAAATKGLFLNSYFKSIIKYTFPKCS
jgi:hypothetical protein